MAKRPLVATAIRTEFGDVQESAEFYAAQGADRDLTYIPGFSDMRRERDLAIADVAAGRVDRRDAKISPLPVNCRWVRKSTPKGAPDAMKQISSGQNGYKVVNKEQIGKVEWLTKLPPGATVEADGSISKGDLVLMVTEGKTAARNAARRQAQTNTMVRSAEETAGGLKALGANTRGADPFVKQEG
jgi:hypothetical protein